MVLPTRSQQQRTSQTNQDSGVVHSPPQSLRPSTLGDEKVVQAAASSGRHHAGLDDTIKANTNDSNTATFHPAHRDVDIESVPWTRPSCVGSPIPCCLQGPLLRAGDPGQQQEEDETAPDDATAPTKEDDNQKERNNRIPYACLALCSILTILLFLLGRSLVKPVRRSNDHKGTTTTGALPDRLVGRQTRWATTTVGGEEESQTNNLLPVVIMEPHENSIVMEDRRKRSPCNNDDVIIARLPPPPPPPLPGKKGAAFTLRDVGEKGSWQDNLPKVVALNPYWNYSWGPKRIVQQPVHIEFVPMLWGYGGNAERFAATMANDILPQVQAGHVKRLLGFNEPDNPVQSNLSLSKALDAWPIMELLNLPLVSPSCWHPEKEWMQSFAASANEICLRMEWVGVHWYGSPSFAEFKAKMEKFHNMYQRPLLVTEFAPADWSATTVADHKWTDATVLDFMKQALPWLETTDWIAGYAWFSFERSSPAGTSSALFDDAAGAGGGGKLTDCGRYYASVRTDRPQGDLRIGTDQDPGRFGG